MIAGAGSGKTRALAHRFAYLVNEVGILPGSILCVTFTNKSAAEMRQRIHQLTGDNDAGYICTFHSFFHIFCKTDLSSRFFRILFALFYQSSFGHKLFGAKHVKFNPILLHPIIKELLMLFLPSPANTKFNPLISPNCSLNVKKSAKICVGW